MTLVHFTVLFLQTIKLPLVNFIKNFIQNAVNRSIYSIQPPFELLGNVLIYQLVINLL